MFFTPYMEYVCNVDAAAAYQREAQDGYCVSHIAMFYNLRANYLRQTI